MKPTLLAGQGIAFFLLILAAALALFYAWVYRQEARQARRLAPWQRATMQTLRIIVAVMAVIALGRPAVTLVRHETRLPVVPIVVDESVSMGFADSRDNPIVQANPPDRRRRYDTAQSVAETLQKKLSLTHRVKIFAFSDGTRLLKEIPMRERESDPAMGREEMFQGAPNPTGEYSNVGDAINDVLRDLAGDRISGMVLLSDGRQTGGIPIKEAGAAAADARVPVHAVAFGTEYPLRDLRIDEVIADPEASLGDVLRFRLKIHNQISSPLDTKLTLLEEGQQVNERKLKLNRGDNMVEIATIPETEGTREFKLKLPVYEDEVDKENNEATVHVKIVKRTLRVLLIAGNPSREFLYLVPALLRDPVVDLSCFLQSADIDYVQQGNTTIERLPRSVEDWKKFDVVILFDPDPNRITTQQVAEMETMVRTGGGLMVISGRNHGLAKLIQVHAVKVRELLPVEIDKNALPDHFQYFERPFTSERTAVGRGHAVMRLDRDDKTNDAVWATFPKLYWAHPVMGVKSQARVLLQKGDGPGKGECLMAIHRYYEGAVFYSGIDCLWFWRYPSESYDYDRFWTNVIRYLGETRLKGTQQQVALSTDRHSYSPGEEVKITLRFLDPALMAQLEGQQILATVTGAQGERQIVPLRPDPKGEMFCAGSYRARRVGSMVVQARQAAPGGSSEAKPLFDVKTAFQVKMQSLEFRDTSGDLDAMRELASQTGGKYFDYRNMGEIEELAAAIPPDPQVLSKESQVEVWDGTTFFLLFLILIGAEWSLRKLWGLL
ncbi:MAG: VWA domain-containing protein [Planctomycetota bacterium]|nr:VWA domain-containing protein [Planctomycetota bacterium]